MLKNYIIRFFVIILFLLQIGCTRSSEWSSSIPAHNNQRKDSTDSNHYDYLHDMPEYKYKVSVVADYREYSATEFPNYQALSGINENFALLKIVYSSDTLDELKYRDAKLNELQKRFNTNPLAALKNELINSSRFIVIERVNSVWQELPDYIVSINVHPHEKHVNCYLAVVDWRTGEMVKSSTAKGESLNKVIQKAVENLVK